MEVKGATDPHSAFWRMLPVCSQAGLCCRPWSAARTDWESARLSHVLLLHLWS